MAGLSGMGGHSGAARSRVSPICHSAGRIGRGDSAVGRRSPVTLGALRRPPRLATMRAGSPQVVFDGMDRR